MKGSWRHIPLMDLHCCQEFAGSNLKAEFRDSFSKSELRNRETVHGIFFGASNDVVTFSARSENESDISFRVREYAQFFPMARCCWFNTCFTAVRMRSYALICVDARVERAAQHLIVMTHAQWKTRAGKIDNEQMTPHPWNELVSPWSSSFYVIVSPRIKTSRTWARIGLRIWIAQTTSESWINFQLPPLLWIIFGCWCVFFLGNKTNVNGSKVDFSLSRVTCVISVVYPGEKNWRW